MNRGKVIVIGCDDTQNLSTILNGIGGGQSLFHVITATRLSDLIGIITLQKPDLIILSFKYNQEILSNFTAIEEAAKIPLICLTKNFENRSLNWSTSQIVFTYPLEYLAYNTGYLGLRINSILLLGKESNENGDSQTLAAAAIQQARSTNQRDLSRYTLELDQKIDVLLKVKSQIVELYPKVDDPTRSRLMSIANMIKLSANDNKLWEDFKLYFQQTNPNFLLFLEKKHPVLTSIDLKYCCYLKMNMSNDDIRSLLGINQESVRTHKYRLKRKMSLSKGQDLRNYLKSVD